MKKKIVGGNKARNSSFSFSTVLFKVGAPGWRLQRG
jgi:hypothetical protein